jgi:hypothetical protein
MRSARNDLFPALDDATNDEGNQQKNEHQPIAAIFVKGDKITPSRTGYFQCSRKVRRGLCVHGGELFRGLERFHSSIAIPLPGTAERCYSSGIGNTFALLNLSARLSQ